MKTYEATIKVTLVAPDADEDGTPENGAADLDELRVSLEGAIADVGEFDVDAAEHPEGVEVWTIDGATVTLIDPEDR